MRPFGCKSEQGKVLQLVQRGTDKRIPVELVKQPSGEVLDPTELEGLHVMVSSESGTGIATIPHTIEDGKLVVEVTADISRHLGLGVYMMTATGRIPDHAYEDGYHDYEVVVPLCKVTKYGSNETPVKVTANVLDGLKGKSAYQSYLDTTTDNPKLTEAQWASINAITTQFLYRINKGNTAPMNEQTLSADQLMELDSHRRALIEALKVKGVGALETDGLETLAIKVRELEGYTPLIVFKAQQFLDWMDEILPDLRLRETYRPADLNHLVARNPHLKKLPTVQGIENATILSNYATQCTALTEATFPDLPKVTSFNSMFKGCSFLERATIGAMPKATDLSFMLGECSSLLTATLGSAPSATTVQATFHYCSALKSVTLDFSGGEITDASYLFNQCGNLRTVTGVLDFTRTTNVGSAFNNCTSLEDVRIKGLKASLDLSACQRLSMESVRYLVENAQTVKSGTINLSRNLLEAHEEGLSELGDAASDKGWTINYR